MLLDSLMASTLYHGTSSARYKSIVEGGFLALDPSYSNFLTPHGFYLTLDRPLIARRFARRAAEAEQGDDIVFSISISSIGKDDVLDLTTDEGLHILYTGYLEILNYVDEQIGSRRERLPKKYREELEKAEKREIEWLDSLLGKNQHQLKSFNWDSAVLRFLFEELDYKIAIASIQEGNTFNKDFSGHSPSYGKVINYKGIRFRDHIEVNVVDLSVLLLDSITIRTVDHDSPFMKDNFGLSIINSRQSDAGD